MVCQPRKYLSKYCQDVHVRFEKNDLSTAAGNLIPKYFYYYSKNLVLRHLTTNHIIDVTLMAFSIRAD